MAGYGLTSFLGNDALVSSLRRAMADDKLPHALLLTGEDGCGRNYLARLIAAEYLGDRSGLTERGIHPDCVTLCGSGATNNIVIDDVRAATSEMSLASVMTEGRRVVIVRDCSSLNRSSFAALLKTLEEPPAGVKFILTASSAMDVAETVRSRCAQYIISPLEPELCARAALERANGAKESDAKWLSDFYAGHLGQVLAALNDQELLNGARNAQRLAELLCGKRLTESLSLLDGIPSKDRDTFRRLMRDTQRGVEACAQDGRTTASNAGDICRALRDAARSMDFSMNMKLVSTRLASGLCR